jgi:hypothetical protein
MTDGVLFCEMALVEEPSSSPRDEEGVLMEERALVAGGAFVVEEGAAIEAVAKNRTAVSKLNLFIVVNFS